MQRITYEMKVRGFVMFFSMWLIYIISFWNVRVVYVTNNICLRRSKWSWLTLDMLKRGYFVVLFLITEVLSLSYIFFFPCVETVLVLVLSWLVSWVEPTEVWDQNFESLFLHTPNKTSLHLLIIQGRDKNKNWNWSPDGVAKTAAEAIIAGKLLLWMAELNCWSL